MLRGPVIALPTTTPVLSHPPARQVDNRRGVLLMMLGMFIFSAVDIQAKYLTATLHPVQIVWIRQSGLLLGVLVLLMLRGRSILITAHPKLQILRGACAATSATIFIFAIRYVPLADAVAVSFVAPFLVTMAGAWLLREPVGLKRWIAVAVGFVGAMIVIRPGTGAIHPAVLLVMVAAAIFAARQIISRYLSADDRTVTTVAYTALVSSALLTLPLPFVWVWPETRLEVILLISIALTAGAAEFLVIKALEVAQAVAVAPVQYSLLIWSTFYGWLVFADLPDAWTWVGALVIVGSGLYTLRR